MYCFYVSRKRFAMVNTYIVVRGATNGATFAFDTLPPVLANRNDHVCSELQTSWMPYNKNVRTSWTTHLGRIWGFSCGMRVERCQDIYLVPKNSELQAIVFLFLFFDKSHFNSLLFFLTRDQIANRISDTREKEHDIWQFWSTKCDSTCLSPFLSTKTSGIMIRPRMFSAQNILFHDICNFLLMLYFEHTVIIWNNRW